MTSVRRSVKVALAGFAVLGFSFFLCGAAPAQSVASGQATNVSLDVSAPTVGKPASNFELPDATGKKRALTEFKDRPVALFFFCGCSACSDVARNWAMQQKTFPQPSSAQTAPQKKLQTKNSKMGSPTASPAKTPLTIIVYSGDAAGASELADQAGLDRKQTLLLSDVEQDVTLLQYKVDPCPRVFVLSPGLVLRYTNDQATDAPQKASGAVIAGKAQEAMYKVIQPAVPAKSQSNP